jgi:hypothetical protein
VRRALLGAGLCLLCGPAALALADQVHVTRFSKTVTGNAGAFSGTVTVNLLRNTRDADGIPVRQQVDSFTTTASAGAWSGSFTAHAFSTSGDQVEIQYTGAGAPAQVTIGSGVRLPSATVAPAHFVSFAANRLDGSVGISSDGATGRITCGCPPMTASVDGGAPITAVGPSFTFSPSVTNAKTILVTGTASGGGTTVTVTDSAPLLTPQPGGVTDPVTATSPQPQCTAYLGTNEVVCRNLVPGSYTLTQKRGTATVASMPLTVPARAATQSLIPSLAAIALSGIAGGDQMILSMGARILSTLMVTPLTFTFTQPVGDIANGANGTIAGTCTRGVFFDDGTALCADGTIPQARTLLGQPLSLGSSVSGRNVIGHLDDTSAGTTEIDLPRLAFQSPTSGDFQGEGMLTPFSAYGLARYNEPAAIVAAQNARPAVGPTPPVVSTASPLPVPFAVAPLGSTTFRPIGNANQPGGVTVPSLPPGPYVDSFTITDARGDSLVRQDGFVVEGDLAKSPPPVPSCTATASNRLKVKIAAAKSKAKKPKRTKKKAKKPKAPKTVTLTVTCTSASEGAHVVLWLERGSGVVVDGAGTVRAGAATIVLRGTLPRGAYTLREAIIAGGRQAQAAHQLTLS